VQSFYAAHRRRYGYAREGEPVELVNLRVTARGLRPTPSLPQHPPAASPDPAPARVGQTRLRFQGQTYDAGVYQRALLQPDHRLPGPALIVQEDATTVVPRGWTARVDPWLNMLFEQSMIND
jgi:N-methylhydantoinase A